MAGEGTTEIFIGSSGKIPRNTPHHERMVSKDRSKIEQAAHTLLSTMPDIVKQFTTYTSDEKGKDALIAFAKNLQMYNDQNPNVLATSMEILPNDHIDGTHDGIHLKFTLPDSPTSVQLFITGGLRIPGESDTKDTKHYNLRSQTQRTDTTLDTPTECTLLFKPGKREPNTEIKIAASLLKKSCTLKRFKPNNTFLFVPVKGRPILPNEVDTAIQTLITHIPSYHETYEHEYVKDASFKETLTSGSGITFTSSGGKRYAI